jgi:Protein of unknown function (DUF2986)
VSRIAVRVLLGGYGITRGTGTLTGYRLTRTHRILLNYCGFLYAGQHWGSNAMNRKKKLNDAFNKKLKKMNAKLRVTNKPKYISKAERESLAVAESAVANDAQT